MRREQAAALDSLNGQLAEKEAQVSGVVWVFSRLVKLTCLFVNDLLQLAESRAQLSEAASREETSQLELDAATADVSSEREVSAANARRGVATDALRVEADGAHHRAEAAEQVTR